MTAGAAPLVVVCLLVVAGGVHGDPRRPAPRAAVWTHDLAVENGGYRGSFDRDVFHFAVIEAQLDRPLSPRPRQAAGSGKHMHA